MIPQFNAIVLDVVVIVILLSLIASGVFKGIAHTFTNSILLFGSILLSFSSITGFIKTPIVNFLNSQITLGVGMSNEAKLCMYLLYPVIASLLLTGLIYVILRLVKYLIVISIRRSDIKRNRLPRHTNITSKICGGVFSLVFNGALFVILLSILSTPLIGLNKTVDSSYVSKYVVDLEDVIIDDVAKDSMLKEKVLLKLIKGDIFVNVSNEDAQIIKELSAFISDYKIIPDSLDNIQVVLDGMYDLLTLVSKHALDENGLEIDGLEKVVELTRNLISSSINAINGLNTDGEKIEAENTLAISNLLRRVIDKEEIVTIFESVFVIK